MLLQSPMKSVTPTVDGDVLLVLARANDWFTVDRLHQVVETRSPAGIRKALLRLVGEGVVEVQEAGRARLYRLNRDHLAAGPIVELANLRENFIRRLGKVLAAWPVPPIYAAIFGSASRGEMKAGSDIDLFLLQPDELPADHDDRVTEVGALASRWTGADVRILEFREAEARGAEQREPVLGDVLKEGLTVLGDRRAFRRYVSTR